MTPYIKPYGMLVYGKFFVLVVPPKLSSGYTLEVFVPQNGNIVVNPFPKPLCTVVSGPKKAYMYTISKYLFFKLEYVLGKGF